MAKRYDRAPMAKARKLDNGFMRAPAHLTRVGVFTYRLPDGSERRELREPGEVFKQDSLDSFELVPLTDEHPSNGVDGGNAKIVTVGTVGHVQRDGDLVAAELLITDAGAVAKVEAGKHELSCGYECDLEPVPGVWRGERYDVVQRNIRGNHVALVTKGRAGPQARIRLDENDAEQIPQTQEPKPMKMITLDGVEVEVAPTVADLIGKERAAAAGLTDALKSKVKECETLLEKQTARADSAEAEVKSLTEKLVVATDAKLVQAAVAARVELENKARATGVEFKTDATDAEIKLAVIAKIDPDAKLEGKSADYVDARFDAALALAAKTNPAAKQMGELVKQAKLDGNPPAGDHEAAFRTAVFRDRGLDNLKK